MQGLYAESPGWGGRGEVGEWVRLEQCEDDQEDEGGEVGAGVMD